MLPKVVVSFLNAGIFYFGRQTGQEIRLWEGNESEPGVSGGLWEKGRLSRVPPRRLTFAAPGEPLVRGSPCCFSTPLPCPGLQDHPPPPGHRHAHSSLRQDVGLAPQTLHGGLSLMLSPTPKRGQRRLADRCLCARAPTRKVTGGSRKSHLWEHLAWDGCLCLLDQHREVFPSPPPLSLLPEPYSLPRGAKGRSSHWDWVWRASGRCYSASLLLPSRSCTSCVILGNLQSLCLGFFICYMGTMLIST